MMESQLNNCTVEEECAVMRFLFAKVEKESKMHGRMLKVYRENCLNREKINK